MWTWPLVIAGSTLVGLIAGLVGDGGWDALAAVALGVPALAAVWFSTRRRRRISRAP
jgi:hypothetical protein